MVHIRRFEFMVVISTRSNFVTQLLICSRIPYDISPRPLPYSLIDHICPYVSYGRPSAWVPVVCCSARRDAIGVMLGLEVSLIEWFAWKLMDGVASHDGAITRSRHRSDYPFLLLLRIRNVAIQKTTQQNPSALNISIPGSSTRHKSIVDIPKVL